MGLNIDEGQYLMNNFGERALTMVRGEGAYLYDEVGKRYLDFTAGIAVCSLGHAHPRVTEAIANQAKILMHCSNLYNILGQNRVAQRLCALSGMGRALFCNSGTEANEGALKLARKYAAEFHPAKTKVLSLPRAFHGRTMGALSLTPKAAYQVGYTPLVPNCISPHTLEAVLAEIDDETAGCFVEIIQGEGGVRVLPLDFLHALEQKLHAHGALLIVDEVQTGIGRTGTFFAFEQTGLHPDIITLAKGLGNGMPVGAVLATTTVAAAFVPGSHGTTFGGNPLAMACAEVVVDVVSNPQFLSHVCEMGQELAQILCKYGENVSGQGLMLGVDIPNAKVFVRHAADCGLLLTATGENRVRVVPSLVIQEEHLLEFDALMQSSLS